MTTLRTTSLDHRTDALDDLAAAAAQASDDARSRAVLAVVVQRLEDAAGAALGDASGDALVVLQRRLGRAAARLAGRPAADVALLRGLALALRPAAVPEQHAQARPAPAAVLAGC